MTTRKDGSDGRWVNVIMCFSNVVGLLAICSARDGVQIILATSATVASMLMHLSERKHGLPGVAPFSRFSTLFLNVDRAIAMLCLAYVAKAWASGWLPARCVWMMLPVAAVGVTALTLSEHTVHKRLGRWWFVGTHSLWHACAFCGLAYVFTVLKREV